MLRSEITGGSAADVVRSGGPIFWIAGEDTGLLFPLVAGMR